MPQSIEESRVQGMSERPPYSIRADLLVWLQAIADEHFDGDLSRALDTALMIVRSWNDRPDDPWAAIQEQKRLWGGSRPSRS